MKLLATLFNFVRLTAKTYKIDESHGISHSMDVFLKSNEIYNSEVLKYPFLVNQKRIIYTAAILHDTCDRKYMDKEDGILLLTEFLQDKFSTRDVDIIIQIISTMSYSYVKKYGFPDLKEYQLAYHIVREADLLAAYDINRSLIYDMEQNDSDLTTALLNSENLFKKRMFKHLDDELFVTEYSKDIAKKFEIESYYKLSQWKHIIDSF